MHSWMYLSLSSSFTAGSQMMFFSYMYMSYEASCPIEEYTDHIAYMARSGNPRYQLAAEGANLMVPLIFSIKFTLGALVALSILSFVANITKNTFCMNVVLVTTGMLAIHNVAIALFGYINSLEFADFNCGKSPVCCIFLEIFLGTEIIIFNLHCVYLQLYMLRKDDEWVRIRIPVPPLPAGAA